MPQPLTHRTSSAPIAIAYKSASLVRLLVKNGAQVKVVMTPLAKEFTVTLTLHGRPAADNYTAVELLY